MELIAAGACRLAVQFRLCRAGKDAESAAALEKVGAAMARHGHDQPGRACRHRRATGIGLLGPNGAGKSTLIKVLAGDHAAVVRQRCETRRLGIGYFAQHQLEQLRLDEARCGICRRLDPRATEQDLRNFLGGFGFPATGAGAGRAVFRRRKGASGAGAAGLSEPQSAAARRADQPSGSGNAPRAERGAAGLSRARWCWSRMTGICCAGHRQLLLVADGGVRPFDGDLDDYRDWLANRKKPRKRPRPKPRRAQPQGSTQAGCRTPPAKHKPLMDALKKAEQAVEKFHQEQRQLEQLLSDPGIYDESKKNRLKEVMARKVQVDKALEDAEGALAGSGGKAGRG